MKIFFQIKTQHYFSYLFYCKLFIFAELVIGFEDTVVAALETVPSVTLQVSILSGTLTEEVEVLLQVASIDSSSATTATGATIRIGPCAL